jgi:hypothetical protein
MSRMASDLHTSLEWVAVTHFNTEHPHVPVVLRGVDGNGEAFKLDRDYVRNGLRAVAQHFATMQLGYRTEQDATPPASPIAALHTAGPADRGAHSSVRRNLRRLSGDGRPDASWPGAAGESASNRWRPG